MHGEEVRPTIFKVESVVAPRIGEEGFRRYRRMGANLFVRRVRAGWATLRDGTRVRYSYFVILRIPLGHLRRMTIMTPEDFIHATIAPIIERVLLTFSPEELKTENGITDLHVTVAELFGARLKEMLGRRGRVEVFAGTIRLEPSGYVEEA